MSQIIVKVELALVCMMILFLNTFVSPAGFVYNKAGSSNRFTCTNYGHRVKYQIVKLVLSSGNLMIECIFESRSGFTGREFLSVFTSGGLTPSMRIVNSTYTNIFHFNLTLFSERTYWLLDIPRENISINTDLAAVEQWLVKITLQHGLNMYTTEGTLLDELREPVLHWDLGDRLTLADISTIYPHVMDVKVTKSPCANDVAIFGFILNSTHDGVYVGVTSSGLWDYNDLKWFNLTNLVYAQIDSELKLLSLVDMVLTNHFFVVLTTLGLYVSGDLRYPTTPVITLSRADFCGFERVDYVKGKLWYNERCYANRENFEVDYITVTFERNKTLSESSTCFYSQEPFIKWIPCLPENSQRNLVFHANVIAFLVDHDLRSGVYLLSSQRGTKVSVNGFQNNKLTLRQKYPIFEFPASFNNPLGMVFHPRSHFLYVYGNQIWLSIDGGNTFQLLADFHKNAIKHTFHSFYTADISFLSRTGDVFFSKAGLLKYSKLGTITDRIFTLYYDHMGFIHKALPTKFVEGASFDSFASSKGIFGKPPDLGFETSLAAQHITLSDIVFFSYVPSSHPVDMEYTKTFNNIHYGKALESNKIGTAYIKEVLHHSTLQGFPSSVIAEVLVPFAVESEAESPCLSSSLAVTKGNKNLFNLTLKARPAGGASKFQSTDVEKTVVIPGYSSLLIIQVIDDEHAVALATMPIRAPINITFPKDDWFLYNFRHTGGRTWKIFSTPCNYLHQHNTQSLNILKYIDLGKSYSFTVKTIPNKRDSRTLGIPLLQVIVGNPNLLDVLANGRFDHTDSYSVTISAASKSLRQGSTSLGLVIWDSSVECYVTSVVLTLKSSCSYLKALYHTPSTIIPKENWNSGVYRDQQGFNMIKTLPINYRPPSNMGIAIPLTDNFYHVDPSQPIPRNLFHKSKNTGKFKQCAEKASRAECNCTDSQKHSQSVMDSDCKEKVRRFKFPVTHYPISLAISSENGLVPIESPYLVTVTEVNGRENWGLRHSVPNTVKKLKDYLEPILSTPVYYPSGLNLSIWGSELFHFRVSVIPGVTFCKLVEEFQIYVDEVPLPFPGHSLIAIATAVALGGLIFIAFMLQIRNVHPWDVVKNFLRKQNRNIRRLFR